MKTHLTINSSFVHLKFIIRAYCAGNIKWRKRMKENSNNLCVMRTVSIYASKIILIFRTRNTYGYNSLCKRIFQLFTRSRRQQGLRISKTSLQY